MEAGNKAGKGDTAAVTTWAEKLLHGLRNTVVATWASPSENQWFVLSFFHLSSLVLMGS